MKQIYALFLLLLTFALPAHALTAEEEAAIASVEKYLSGLTTIVADFTQIAPSGNLVSGKFYLERPGKMRWQYDPPTPVLMLADGNFLIFYDYELDQVSHIPLQDTLAGFLARKTIAFGGEQSVLILFELNLPSLVWRFFVGDIEQHIYIQDQILLICSMKAPSLSDLVLL